PTRPRSEEWEAVLDALDDDIRAVVEQRRDDDEPSGPLDVVTGAEMIEVVDDAEFDGRQVLAELIQVFPRGLAVHRHEGAQERHGARERAALAPELAQRFAENVQAFPRLQSAEEDQVVVVDLRYGGLLLRVLRVGIRGHEHRLRQSDAVLREPLEHVTDGA